MNPYLAAFLLGFLVGAYLTFHIGYRAAVRKSGVGMVRAGARRVVSGRF